MTIYSRLILLITLISSQLQAADTCTYSFTLLTPSNKIIITLTPPENASEFIYSPHINGIFSQVQEAFTISNINAYSSSKTHEIKKCDNKYQIRTGEKIDSIKYQITINRKQLSDGAPFLINESDFLFIPAFICLLPATKYSSINLSITTNKSVTTPLPINKTNTLVKIGITNNDALSVPILISKEVENNFLIKNKNFHVIHFSNKTDTIISTLISEILKSPDIHPEVYPEHYYIFLKSTTINHQQFSKITSQQSQFENNYCIANLPESFNNSDLKSYIYNICAEAEVGVLVNNFTLNYTAIHSSPWINEGLRPYLTLQNLCKNGILSERDFLTELTEKIEGSASLPLLTLADYQNNSFFNKYEQYRAVSNRSILFSWLLDIQIITLTNAQSSLANVLSNIASNKDLSIASDEDLVQEVVRLTHPDIQEFFNEYYYHPRAFQYKKLLKTGGYIYISGEVADLYKAGPIEIEFNDSDRRILLRKKNLCFGNLPGDELIAVNGRPAGRRNIYQLFRIYFTRNFAPDEITIMIRRNGEIIKLACSPVLKKEEVTFFIYPDINASKLQYISRKIITGN